MPSPTNSSGAMKRFYRMATVEAAAGGGFAVTLDGKPLRTPAKAPLILPSRALAQAIAAEWNAQGEKIARATLPLTGLASAAVDLAAPRRAAIVADLAKYAETELLCYRADQPPALVEQQQRLWQPLLDWAALRFDAPLRVGVGVLPLEQPSASLAALAAAIDAHDVPALTALDLAVRASGSLILGLALSETHIDAAAAFTAAQLEESFEIERWGVDEEQTQRRAALSADIALAERFWALLRG